MSDALRWLLRLDTLNFGQPGVEFGFTQTWPLWVWAAIVVGAGLLGWLCYRRLEGPRWGRLCLGSLRTATLIVLAVLIAGPRLLKPNEIEESDWVLVLVDRSASLGVKDANPPGSQSRITRDQQLRTALRDSAPAWKQLGAERVVVWLGFDAGAYELKAPADSATGMPVELADPVGRRTDLNRAIEQALKKAAARPLSGVVVLSDGRGIEEPSRALLRRLEAEKIPVFTLALGQERGLADLSLRRVEAPRAAFVNDLLPVEVELESFGGPGDSASTATVELIDKATGNVLDTQEVTFPPAVQADPQAAPGAKPADTARKVTLTTRPSSAGNAGWSVRVRPSSSGSISDDLVTENNSADLSVELIDRPLRVLYLDGYPRWEYRYLKNVLVREPSIACSVTILAPDRRYIQEGTDVLDAMPASPEEWAKFDVLVIGDVIPTVFTQDQLQQIRDRVATAGLGLVWVAGEGAVPGSWRSTPLGDLIPFASGESAGSGPFGGRGAGVESWGEPVMMSPTPAADGLGVLRLAEQQGADGSWWPPRLSDPATGWAQLRWAQRIDPKLLKPTTEALAVATPALARPDSGPTTATPLVMSMRFGAGRVIYIATDEIWRWRYGRGEYFTERFWLQIVRLLGRESVARSGKPAMLQVLPERGETDRPFRIEITLLDQVLVEAAPSSLRVRIEREPRNPEEGVELSLLPETASGSSVGGKQPRVFSATWVPGEAGRYHVEAIDPVLLSAGGSGASGRSSSLAVVAEVWQPGDELRQPQADHLALARLSSASGGKVLQANELSQLSKLLPNRKLKLSGEPDVRTLWDTPLALILVVLFLTAEWIGRRLLRLA